MRKLLEENVSQVAVKASIEMGAVYHGLKGDKCKSCDILARLLLKFCESDSSHVDLEELFLIKRAIEQSCEDVNLVTVSDVLREAKSLAEAMASPYSASKSILRKAIRFAGALAEHLSNIMIDKTQRRHKMTLNLV